MTLKEAVGKHCRLVNHSYDNSAFGRVQIHAHGSLEEHDDGEFYLRIGDDSHGHGCNGVSFFQVNVEEVFKQPSGIVHIQLKG